MIFRLMGGLLLLIFSAIPCLAADPPATVAVTTGGKNVTSVEPKGKEVSESCAEPAKGPIAPNQQQSSVGQTPAQSPSMPPMARVGKPAPDFEANAFQDGKFKNIKLSDYKGRWVALCFYPGDFTFV